MIIPRLLSRFLARLLIAYFAVLLSSLAVFAQSSVSLRIITSSQEGIGAELRFVPEPGWHIYWKYPGDSGSTTKTKWLCDAQVPSFPSEAGKAGTSPLRWPIPEVIAVGPLVNYGYDHPIALEYLLPCNRATTREVAVDVEWLVCKEECIPQFASLRAHNEPSNQDSEGGTQLFPEQEHIKTTGLIIGSVASVALPHSLLAATGTTALPAFRFIPDGPGIIVNAASQPFKDLKLELSLQPRVQPPTTISGLLRVDSAPGAAPHSKVRAYPISIELTSATAPNTAAAFGVSLVKIALAAFLGGLLLNIMPCVFPVLGIKIYQLISASERVRRVNALMYSVGVVTSMLVLAGVLVVLRAVGFEQIGWGSQLQSPFIVFLLMIVFLLLGANLLGFFEFGTRVQVAAGKVSVSGPFMDGLLTVVVATPCTAPFMAGAVGYALSASSLEQVFIFLALGAGVAFPVLMVGVFPAVARILPRPGAWMELFKQLLAWPLILSASWLFLVLLRQVGADRIVPALSGVLLVGFGLWLFRALRPRRLLKAILLAVFAVALGALGVVLERGASAGQGVSIEEVAYSEERLNQLRAEGKGVFLDVTALWCITCQVNKQLVINTKAIQSAFAERGVVWMEADWTEPSAEITRLLGQFSRAGVPLNVYFPPGREADPIVFEPVLTVDAVLEALGPAKSTQTDANKVKSAA